MPHLNIPLSEADFRVHEARKVALGAKSWNAYISKMGEHTDATLPPGMQAAIAELRE